METDPADGQDGPSLDAFQGSEPAGSAPRRVLLVDDEPGAADLAATHVERLVDGVETITRTTPADALAVIREQRVDCVVSDYNMPGSDGLELLEDVRAIDPGLPFVLFTGRGSEEIASEAISAGVTDYLQKGVGRDRYEMLANSVENALDRRRVERDLRDVNAKVTAIHKFASDVTTAEDATDVFSRLICAAQGILEFDRCVSVRRRGDELIPAARSENVSEDEVRTFDLGEGVVGATVAEERTIVVDNLSVDPADPHELEDPNNPGRETASEARTAGGPDSTNDPNSPEAIAEPVGDNIRSAISVPIGSYGAFQAFSDGHAAFDQSDVEFAELLAAHAADALEQIETEDTLRAERDRLAALFDELPLPVVRTVSKQGAELRLDATNEAFEEVFGFSAVGRDYEAVRDKIVPDHREDVDPVPVIAADEPLQQEVERDTTDGLRDFILNVLPVERPDETIVYALYADIGEQKRVARTLRRLHKTTREMLRGESREEIASIATRAAIDILEFPSSGVRLYDPDANTLLPTAISQEATDALGERPAYGPGDNLLWKTFETGELVVVDDLKAVDTAISYGDHRSLLIVPLGDHGVMPLGSLKPGVFDDTAIQLARVLGANVTVALDHAQRTTQLRERDAELQREIDRLEKFAGMVSHDLRNPLNVAAGRLDLAQALVDDADALEELNGIAAAHDRMQELIDDLLALAQQGQTVDELEPVSLSQTAVRAWQTVDTADAVLNCPDESITVEADPERLRTLLENLFTNSVEHGSTSDTDSVSAGGVTVTVGALSDGFYVADDGPGFEIDPEEAFEYGTSSDPCGTGFGLAIVREIAAAHGWTFDVTDDDGARFAFRTDG